MPRKITMQELDAKAQELGTIGAATKWMRENGLTLEDAGSGELPPVAQQPVGALSQTAESEPQPDALEYGNLDFNKMRDDPNAFFKVILDAQRSADERAAQSSTQLYEEGRKRIMEKYSGPSQSEQLFALSRAMLSPRKVPGFKGFLGNVVGTLGDNATAMQQAQRAREEQLFALQQQYQQGAAEREAARPRTALELAKTYADVTAPAKRRTGFNPVTGDLVDMETNQPVGSENLPVLSPDQVGALSRDPRNRGMKFRTTDGRVMEIK